MLGLRTAQLFSDRLFASFDLDDDNVVIDLLNTDKLRRFRGVYGYTKKWEGV
jgi:hypothetical protein